MESGFLERRFSKGADFLLWGRGGRRGRRILELLLKGRNFFCIMRVSMQRKGEWMADKKIQWHPGKRSDDGEMRECARHCWKSWNRRLIG